jgi:hypothetical protein
LFFGRSASGFASASPSTAVAANPRPRSTTTRARSLIRSNDGLTFVAFVRASTPRNPALRARAVAVVHPAVSAAEAKAAETPTLPRRSTIPLARASDVADADPPRIAIDLGNAVVGAVVRAVARRTVAERSLPARVLINLVLFTHTSRHDTDAIRILWTTKLDANANANARASRPGSLVSRESLIASVSR